MTSRLLFALPILLALCNACGNSSKSKEENNTRLSEFHAEYESRTLLVKRLSDHVYEHTSFLDSEEFGKVDCNGMIVVDESEAVVFDTPSNNESSEELIAFVTEKLKARIVAIIPTHFHEDCVAGLQKFSERGIRCYASQRTIDFLKLKDVDVPRATQAFMDTLSLRVGEKKIYAGFFGEGHTRDNIVGYFPEDEAVFGGCLIKSVGAGKGNLADANVEAWPSTVGKLREAYPKARIVIPGHGKSGGPDLFDYTIKLFNP